MDDENQMKGMLDSFFNRGGDMTELYLGCVMNLVQISTEARLIVSKDLSALMPFLSGEFTKVNGPKKDTSWGGSWEILCRAATILQKWLLQDPELQFLEEKEKLKIFEKSLELADDCFSFKTSLFGEDVDLLGDGEANELALKWLDICVRLMTVLVTKSDSFQKMFVADFKKWPKMGIVVKGGSANASSGDTNANSTTKRYRWRDSIKSLVKIACLIKPTQYIDFNDKSSSFKENKQHKAQVSLVRGNLALVFAELVVMEGKQNVNFGLAGIVEVFIEMLRKERGMTQKNAGVAVTKLAMSERYRPIVRELKGFESLHQITMQE